MISVSFLTYKNVFKITTPTQSSMLKYLSGFFHLLLKSTFEDQRIGLILSFCYLLLLSFFYLFTCLLHLFIFVSFYFLF